MLHIVNLNNIGWYYYLKRPSQDDGEIIVDTYYKMEVYYIILSTFARVWNFP